MLFLVTLLDKFLDKSSLSIFSILKLRLTSVNSKQALPVVKPSKSFNLIDKTPSLYVLVEALTPLFTFHEESFNVI